MCRSKMKIHSKNQVIRFGRVKYVPIEGARGAQSQNFFEKSGGTPPPLENIAEMGGLVLERMKFTKSLTCMIVFFFPPVLYSDLGV